jgi:hypothetical protein
MSRKPFSTSLLVEIIVEVVVRPENDVVAAYGVVDLEPLQPRDEYSRRTARLTWSACSRRRVVASHDEVDVEPVRPGDE